MVVLLLVPCGGQYACLLSHWLIGNDGGPMRLKEAGLGDSVVSLLDSSDKWRSRINKWLTGIMKPCSDNWVANQYIRVIKCSG